MTGATGFIGNALAQTLLAQGDEVRILSRRPVDATGVLRGAQWFQGDLCRPIDVGFLDGVDIVYHLAAELHDPTRMSAVNVQGTKNLLAAAAGRLRRWIQLSSVGVYGPPKDLVINEDTSPAPANEYERTKLAGDHLVEEACRRNGTEYTILRPSNVIGANMKIGSVFALVNAVRRRRYFYIGPRDAVATYVHIEDVVAALVACQAAPTGRIYNLSCDCLWKELIECIASAVGVSSPRLRLPAFPMRLMIRLLEGWVPLPLTSGGLASLTNRSCYPADRIVKELGFTFARPLPEAIEDIVNAMS